MQVKNNDNVDDDFDDNDEDDRINDDAGDDDGDDVDNHVGFAGGGQVESHHQVGEAVKEERVGGGLGLCLQCPGQGYWIEKHGSMKLFRSYWLQ